MEDDVHDVVEDVRIQYEYRTSVTQYLPHKLAEFIGTYFEEGLSIERENSQRWSVKELNNILHDNIIPDRSGTHLHTCEKLEWEHEDYDGRAMASAAPFTKKHGRYNKVCQWYGVFPLYIVDGHVKLCVNALMMHHT